MIELNSVWLPSWLTWLDEQSSNNNLIFNDDDNDNNIDQIASSSFLGENQVNCEDDKGLDIIQSLSFDKRRHRRRQRRQRGTVCDAPPGSDTEEAPKKPTNNGNNNEELDFDEVRRTLLRLNNVDIFSESEQDCPADIFVQSRIPVCAHFAFTKKVPHVPYLWVDLLNVFPRTSDLAEWLTHLENSKKEKKGKEKNSNHEWSSCLSKDWLFLFCEKLHSGPGDRHLPARLWPSLLYPNHNQGTYVCTHSIRYNTPRIRKTGQKYVKGYSFGILKRRSSILTQHLSFSIG